MEHAMDIRDVKITKLEADNMILQVIISYTYHILIEIQSKVPYFKYLTKVPYKVYLMKNQGKWLFFWNQHKISA